MTALHAKRGGSSAATQGVAAVRIGQVYLDVRRRLLHCLNEQARRLQREGIPFTPQDLERQPLQTQEGETVRADELPLVRAWRENKVQEGTYVLCREGATPVHITWSAAPVHDATGTVVGVMGSIVCQPPEPDWTVLAGLAHDLRSPLQSLRMLLALLETSPALDAGQQQTVLQHIRSSAERAQLIGQDLLEWCRGPVKGGRRVQQSWFPLEPFLSALLGEQTGAAQRKLLELHADLAAASGWEVQSDRVRLGRLLANLLSNAVRYTPAGRVSFTAAWREQPGQALAVSVADTGTGIAPEEQDSIFQVFERGYAAKQSDPGGSGVGLAVVDQLVEELGLELEVFSEFGRGSSFCLVLPAHLLRQAGTGSGATAGS